MEKDRNLHCVCGGGGCVSWPASEMLQLPVHSWIRRQGLFTKLDREAEFMYTAGQV